MRNFSARETEWLQELDGVELANFWPRAVAFLIDWVLIWVGVSLFVTLSASAYLGVRHLEGKPMPDFQHMSTKWLDSKDPEISERKLGNGLTMRVERTDDKQVEDIEHLINRVILPILYFGTLTWRGKGRTPGKRIMKIRVVSLMHRHLSFWHSVERALGYGAALLEGGFGFVQFFIHPYRRCVQDRIAETIVVTERSYQQLQHRLSHPLIPDEK